MLRVPLRATLSAELRALQELPVCHGTVGDRRRCGLPLGLPERDRVADVQIGFAVLDLLEAFGFQL